MKSKGYLYLSLVGAGLLLASCATAPATGGADGEDGSQSGLERSATQDSAVRAPGEALPIFRPDPASAEITAMRWGPDEALQLGYADGKWAAIDARRRDAALYPGVDGKAPVVSISQNGELILFARRPRRLFACAIRKLVFGSIRLSRCRRAGFSRAAWAFLRPKKLASCMSGRARRRYSTRLRSGISNTSRCASRRTSRWAFRQPSVSGW